MAERKYDKYFMTEPFGKVKPGAGARSLPGAPIDKPYWIGIGQEDPEPWGFPLSMVLRPIWKDRVMFARGSHTHDVGEVLMFIGGDPMNFDEFGADVEVILGEEQESYFINKTTFLYVPPGLPHSPITISNVRKPIMFGHIMFTDVFKFEYSEKENKPN